MADPGRRVLGLIPARGGSKGVPRKNIRPLGGRPLIAWTVEQARAARGIDVVVVSTDDLEIREAARDAGAEVPFLRAPELAADATPTLPVVLDALDRLERTHGTFDAVCLLQPTSPLRRPGLIDEAIDRLMCDEVDSVISVRRLPPEHHPDWALVATEDGSVRWATGHREPPPRRQGLSAAYHREGSVYVTRTSVLRTGSLYGDRIIAVEVTDKTVNIDTASDWARAELLFAAGSLGTTG